MKDTQVLQCSHFRTMASSFINSSQRVKVTGAKVNIDLWQLELLRASQVCVALIVEPQLTHRSQQYHTEEFVIMQSQHNIRLSLSSLDQLSKCVCTESHARSFVWLLLKDVFKMSVSLSLFFNTGSVIVHYQERLSSLIMTLTHHRDRYHTFG